MSDIIIAVGDLVYYRGPPIYYPQDWSKISINTNGIINFDEIAIVLESDDFLKIAKLYFQENEVEIPRLSHKFLIKIF